MHRRRSRLGLCLLVALLTGLLLLGAVLVARQRVLDRTRSTFFTPLSGQAEWEGDWAFSEQGADPSQAGTERVTIPFTGTDFALRVRRGDYRGTFFVTVDGQPANLLPQDARGAYLVLSSPDGAPQVVTIPVAAGLADQRHQAVVIADRGWDQWPLVGWEVGRTPDTTSHRRALTGLVLVVMVALAGVTWWGVGLARRWAAAQGEQEAKDVSGLRIGLDGKMGKYAPLVLLAVVTLFYFSPWWPLTLLAGLGLAGLVLFRLDLGLALVAVAAPFYLHPRVLLGKSFSLVEIATLLCVLSWAARNLRLRRLPSLRLSQVTLLDVAVLGFVLVAGASFFVAEFRHVALRELRVLILEPALFYLVLRTTPLDERQVWRLVDWFVLGAVIVAVIGLAQYGTGTNVITAESGFRRLRSVYGSPNSVGLYLGRAFPLLVAVVLFAGSRRRRWLYGLAIVPLGLAVLFSFSKGALLLGVPLSMLVLGMLAGGPWLRASLGAVVLAGLAAVPLFRTPRFAGLLNPHTGTLFFRLHLWRSSWTMFREHPWLGVGPDNFLYLYRSRYIHPAAWQEPNLSQAHNVLLDYATRMGVPGLLVGGGLQVAFWRLAIPLRRLTDPDRRALALGLMASMANFLAHGLVDASYFLIDLAYVFFLTLGLVHWLVKERE